MSPTSTGSFFEVEGQESCKAQLASEPGGFTNASEKTESRRGLLRQRLIEKRKFARTEGPCKRVSQSIDYSFIDRVQNRVAGKKLEDLIFVELFSGTGGLCAEVLRLGLSNSVGVDAHVSKHAKCPVLRIDMTTQHGMELVWRILAVWSKSSSTSILQVLACFVVCWSETFWHSLDLLLRRLPHH